MLATIYGEIQNKTDEDLDIYGEAYINRDSDMANYDSVCPKCGHIEFFCICECGDSDSKIEHSTQINCVHCDNLSAPEFLDVKPNSAFVEYIRESAEKFHELIVAAKNVKRFLGNASFRCTHGFPSFWYQDDDTIYVSRRNIDQSQIGAASFVPCRLHPNMPWSSKIAVTNGIRRTPKPVILYGGEHKPAVDAAVQLAIYKHCPRINFMIHAHVNIKDALTTAVPRGGFEEIGEILSAVGYMHSDGFALNLKGHGCLIGVERLEDFRNYWGNGIPNAITLAV